MTVIFVFMAIAFGLMLFSSMQDKIPDELSFLRGNPGSMSPEPLAPGTKVIDYKGWRITQVGSTVESLKSFQGPLMVNDGAHTAPTIGILCYENKLDIRIDSKEPTTGIKSSEVVVGKGSPQLWPKGTGNNLFPPEPGALLRELLTATVGVPVTLSYRTLGAQASTLDTAGLIDIVKQLPANCRP